MMDGNGKHVKIGDYVAIVDWASNYKTVLAIVTDMYVDNNKGRVVVKYIEGGYTEIRFVKSVRKMSKNEIVLWKLECLA